MPVVFAAPTLLQRSEWWGESLPSLSQLGQSRLHRLKYFPVVFHVLGLELAHWAVQFLRHDVEGLLPGLGDELALLEVEGLGDESLYPGCQEAVAEGVRIPDQ